jgi:hypothetical protein
MQTIYEVDDGFYDDSLMTDFYEDTIAPGISLQFAPGSGSSRWPS